MLLLFVFAHGQSNILPGACKREAPPLSHPRLFQDRDYSRPAEPASSAQQGEVLPLTRRPIQSRSRVFARCRGSGLNKSQLSSAALEVLMPRDRIQAVGILDIRMLKEYGFGVKRVAEINFMLCHSVAPWASHVLSALVGLQPLRGQSVSPASSSPGWAAPFSPGTRPSLPAASP